MGSNPTLRPRALKVGRRGSHPVCGGSHRFLRDDQPQIPSGPEGSSGSGDVGCRRSSWCGPPPTRPRRARLIAIDCHPSWPIPLWRGNTAPRSSASCSGRSTSFGPCRTRSRRARASRVPVHGNARRRQDHHRAHLRQVPQLHSGRGSRRPRSTADPCGVCAACVEIDVGPVRRPHRSGRRVPHQGRRYARAAGQRAVRAHRARYKVYLIDEVHMLSTHSFNALLKTLEEPPPHVKFLLATTDPQKLPVTVLSRCLQFNLKRLPLSQISRSDEEAPGGGERPVRCGRGSP